MLIFIMTLWGSSPAVAQDASSSRCRDWDDEARVSLALAEMKTLEQLIAQPQGPKGHDPASLEKAVSPRCRVDARARRAFREQALLAELKCEYFQRKLDDIGDCASRDGMAPSSPPEHWDERSWDGQAAWNRSFAALDETARCLRLKQALTLAIARVGTSWPTFDIRGFSNQGDHGLFVHPPKAGHLRDRKTAAWINRFARFTDPSLVPARCRDIKQEGDLRFIEAEDLWKDEFPQVFGRRTAATPFGRQALGYAFGMCGRCNNAHYADSALKIIEYNERQKDPALRIEVAPALETFLKGLDSGPWKGDIKWEDFARELERRKKGEDSR